MLARLAVHTVLSSACGSEISFAPAGSSLRRVHPIGTDSVPMIFLERGRRDAKPSLGATPPRACLAPGIPRLSQPRCEPVSPLLRTSEDEEAASSASSSERLSCIASRRRLSSFAAGGCTA